MRFGKAYLFLVLAVMSSPALRAQPGVLEEIVVTAALREAPAASVPVSVSVLDEETLREAAVQHFDELALRVPNLNLSGEGARVRYFQLRGVGDLEQYEGAPNPALGFIVDDIDFSSLGSVATLFDLSSIEVLRGPQGTRYGANALGGLIYVRSAEPPEVYSARVETTLAGEDTWGVGLAAGGPLAGRAGWQASVHQFQSDGFRRNSYLQRSDTNGADEFTARAKFVAYPGENTRAEFNLLHVDLADGYDAWSIDSDRVTESDRPGEDHQQSTGAAVRIEHEFERFDLVSISTWAHTESDLGFDADWGNPELWAPYRYDFFSRTLRERRNLSQEVRLLSQASPATGARFGWLAGLYTSVLDESNDKRDTGVYDDPDTGRFDLDLANLSDYEARHAAVFGQLELGLTPRLTIESGLRLERREADYSDSIGNRFDPVDDMVGGELAAIVRLRDELRVFARLARGYRAGGFNLGFTGVDLTEIDATAAAQIEFEPEYLWNVELGLKGSWQAYGLTAELSAFAARRDAQQIKIPIQLRSGDPSSFLFVTANAERGQDAGLEAQLQWQPVGALTISMAAGLLRTKIERFALLPDLEGRAQAHAPEYSLTTSARYAFSAGWWARVDVVARDGFYYDYSHSQQADSSVLPAFRMGRDWSAWSFAVWVRNLSDADYTTRGFYFGNEPPDFADRLYTRPGDPRQFGMTLRYRM